MKRRRGCRVSAPFSGPSSAGLRRSLGMGVTGTPRYRFRCGCGLGRGVASPFNLASFQFTLWPVSGRIRSVGSPHG